MKTFSIPLCLAMVFVLCAFTVPGCRTAFALVSHGQRHIFGIETPWNHHHISRKTDESCDCGIIQKKSKAKPWNVFIQVKTKSKKPRICIGTIITKNLIATSHECFLYSEKTFNIYDLWRPKGGEMNAIWEPKDVQVCTSRDFSNPNATLFEVENIIYNPFYAVNSGVKVFPPKFDLALVKIKEFTPTPSLYPICIPSQEIGLEMEENLKARADIEAYYYGIEGQHEIPDVIKGEIESETDDKCKERLKEHKFEMKYNLCYSFIPKEGSTPKKPGGPLYLRSKNSGRAFLIGIASYVSSQPMSEEDAATGKDYDYFTNLLSLIKYIELIADEHKSTWCKLPKIEHLDIAQLESHHQSHADGKDREDLPWEVAPPAARNESLNCVCGIPNKVIEGRVVGGETTNPLEFPWMTYLKIFLQGKGKGGNGICGGSIINDRMVLSAAHCVVSDMKVKREEPHVTVNPEDIELALKVHGRHADDDRIIKEVSAILFHPEYAYAKKHGMYFDYDVAIFVLKEPIEFDSHPIKGLRPICLPKQGFHKNLVGETVTVAGWGLTDPTDKHSAAEELQKLDLPLVDLSKCREVATAKVTDRNLCAGYLNRYKDAAAGDSGGPLMLKNGDRYTEVGIVSWGEDVESDGEIKTAALYTDVQQMSSFIDYHAHRLQANWCRSDKSVLPTTSTHTTQSTK